MFRRVADEQVYVFGFAGHFDQLCLEVGTNLFEDDFEPLDRVSVKHFCSILCDEDQVHMQCKDPMPAVTNVVLRFWIVQTFRSGSGIT